EPALEPQPVQVVERPQERRERLARARRRDDQRVAPGRDRRPAVTLWCGGLGERRVEPRPDERQKLWHVRSLYRARQRAPSGTTHGAGGTRDADSAKPPTRERAASARTRPRDRSA